MNWIARILPEQGRRPARMRLGPSVRESFEFSQAAGKAAANGIN
jgi:hypothetical protein